MGFFKDDKLQPEDGCENAQEVASKYGMHLVCDDDETAAAEAEKHAGVDPNCENAQEVASKYGYQIVCEDDEV